MYVGYVQGVASALVLQTLLEDKQRAKCGGVVDGPYVSYLTVNSGKEQYQNKHQTRDRSFILIISISFGQSLFTGSHVCIRDKIILNIKEKVHIRAYARA